MLLLRQNVSIFIYIIAIGFLLPFDAISASYDLTTPMPIHLEIGENLRIDTNRLDDIYIADNDLNIVKWNPEKKSLLGNRTGTATLFLVYNRELLRIPINIGQIPATGRRRVTKMESLISKGISIEADPHARYEPPRQNAKRSFYDIRTKELDARRISFQVQYLHAPFGIQPVTNATLELIGFSLSAKTDHRGMVTIEGAPAARRFLVRVSDDLSRFYPTIVEVFANQNQDDPVAIKVVRWRYFDLLQDFQAVVQRPDLASFCITAQSKYQSNIQGLKVRTNFPHLNPLYFRGKVPTKARGLDDHGRSCIFNAPGKLIEIKLYDKESNYIFGMPIPLFPGSHSEFDIDIEKGVDIAIPIGVSPFSYSLIYGNDRDTSMLRHLDYTEVVVIGDNEMMDYRSKGVLSYRDAIFFNNRIYALSMADEFENTLHSIDLSAYSAIPLFQRGTTLDIFDEVALMDSSTPVALDPALGIIIVEYPNAILNRTGAAMKLYDAAQNAIEGWNFGRDSNKIQRQIFFNLTPGIYTAVLKTPEGKLADIETMATDYETVSVVELGFKRSSSTLVDFSL